MLSHEYPERLKFITADGQEDHTDFLFELLCK